MFFLFFLFLVFTLVGVGAKRLTNNVVSCVMPSFLPQASRLRREYVLKGQNDGIAFLAWSHNDSLLLSCGKEDSPEALVFSTEVSGKV